MHGKMHRREWANSHGQHSLPRTGTGSATRRPVSQMSHQASLDRIHQFKHNLLGRSQSTAHRRSIALYVCLSRINHAKSSPAKTATINCSRNSWSIGRNVAWFTIVQDPHQWFGIITTAILPENTDNRLRHMFGFCPSQHIAGNR